MKKNLFLIPGFYDKTSDEKYQWLIKFLKSKGFKVIEVPVKWEHRTISDYITDFKEFYSNKKSGNDYILGFSYGAVIAFSTAAELRPKKIFLCSLSPDFKEDAPRMKRWIVKLLGKKRFADIQTRSARDIAKKLNVPSVLFYGEKEAKVYPDLKLRAEETVKLAKNSKLIVVPNAHHDISEPAYISAIEKEFRF